MLQMKKIICSFPEFYEGHLLASMIVRRSIGNSLSNSFFWECKLGRVLVFVLLLTILINEEIIFQAHNKC